MMTLAFISFRWNSFHAHHFNVPTKGNILAMIPNRLTKLAR